jgi:FkbM family methyltransferase
MLNLSLKLLWQRFYSSHIPARPENIEETKKSKYSPPPPPHQGVRNYSIGQFSLTFPADHQLPNYQEAHRLYDRYFGSWLKFLRVEDRTLKILDIGANVGDSAFYFLSCESDSKIYAVEADPIFYSFLLHNITKHKAENSIIPLNYALLPSSLLEDQYRIVSNHGTAKLVSGEFQQEELEVVQTEDFTKVGVDFILGYSSFDFIKIDIDSFDALLGIEFLHRVESSQSVLLVEIDTRSMENNTSNISDLVSQAIASRYSFIVVDNKGRVLGSHFNTLENFTDLLKWIEIQWKLESVDVHYLDVWFFPASKEYIFKNICAALNSH